MNLDEIRRITEAATLGPWSWASHTTADGDEWAVFDRDDRPLAMNHDGWWHDAEFIANARTWVPELLDRIEFLEGQLEVFARAAVATGNKNRELIKRLGGLADGGPDTPEGSGTRNGGTERLVPCSGATGRGPKRD